MKRCLIIISLFVLIGCSSSIRSAVPGSELIRVTQNGADVTQCKPLGEVHAYPPFFLPGDAERTIRNRTVVMGGNTVLTSSTDLVVANGFVYKCD